jgi:hypothetical protein
VELCTQPEGRIASNTDERQLTSACVATLTKGGERRIRSCPYANSPVSTLIDLARMTQDCMQSTRSVAESQAAEIAQSMQYMNARNGGLLIDFQPIRDYLSISPGSDHYERVRTVLDWVAFAVTLGLVSPNNWCALFDNPSDFEQFVRELRQYAVPLNPRHVVAFELLGLVAADDLLDYSGIAAIIECKFGQRARHLAYFGSAPATEHRRRAGSS